VPTDPDTPQPPSPHFFADVERRTLPDSPRVFHIYYMRNEEGVSSSRQGVPKPTTLYTGLRQNKVKKKNLQTVETALFVKLACLYTRTICIISDRRDGFRNLTAVLDRAGTTSENCD